MQCLPHQVVIQPPSPAAAGCPWGALTTRRGRDQSRRSAFANWRNSLPAVAFRSPSVRRLSWSCARPHRGTASLGGLCSGHLTAPSSGHPPASLLASCAAHVERSAPEAETVQLARTLTLQAAAVRRPAGVQGRSMPSPAHLPSTSSTPAALRRDHRTFQLVRISNAVSSQLR